MRIFSEGKRGMGLEELEKEIIETSEKEAASTISQANSEAEKLSEEYRKRTREQKNKADSEIKTAVGQLEKKELSLAEFNAKRAVFEEKKALLEKAFKNISARLAKLSEKTREKHVNRLIEKAKKHIEIYTIYCNKTDEKLIKDFKNEETPILGGIIAENKEKTERLDLSYEMFLEQIKEKNLREIAAMLFGK